MCGEDHEPKYWKIALGFFKDGYLTHRMKTKVQENSCFFVLLIVLHNKLFSLVIWLRFPLQFSINRKHRLEFTRRASQKCAPLSVRMLVARTTHADSFCTHNVTHYDITGSKSYACHQWNDRKFPRREYGERRAVTMWAENITLELVNEPQQVNGQKYVYLMFTQPKADNKPVVEYFSQSIVKYGEKKRTDKTFCVDTTLF